MDYAPSQCQLLRTFGEGKEAVALRLGRLGIDDVLELNLAGRHMPETDSYVAVEVSTTTVEQVPGMHARGFAGGNGLPGMIEFRPDKDLPGALRSDAVANQPTHMRVSLAKRYAVRLELGPMKDAIAALDKCTDNLVSQWGLDPTEQRERATPPEPANDPANWFRASDYPAGLNRAGLSGAVVMRLIVDATGSVKDCAVAKAGGDKAFEELTCKLAIQRARFRPATGKTGAPIASVWIKRINWQAARPFVIQRW